MPVTSARLAQHHAELGDAFSDVVAPAVFPQTVLRFRNQSWAERVGLGDLTEDDWSALHAKLAAIDRMAEAYGTRVTPLGAPSTPLRA